MLSSPTKLFSLALTLTLLSVSVGPASIQARQLAEPVSDTTRLRGNESKQVISTLSPEDTLEAGISYKRREYRLGPDDELNVTFFGAEELNQQNLRVAPGGQIQLPAIGSVQAGGLTLSEFQEEITSRYSRYLKNPQVTVNLTTTKSFVTYVNGAVLNPGSYEFNTNPSAFAPQFTDASREFNVIRTTPLLSSVLVAAGGITYDADVEHVQVNNAETGEHFEVNLMELLNSSQAVDIYLTQGDVVTVPKLRSAFAVDEERYKVVAGATFAQQQIPVKVYGYVQNPGLINLDAAQPNTLHSAITSAGAYGGDFAFQPSKVLLSRVDGHGHLVTREVDPRKEDPILMPNDIVYVPEKAIGKVVRTFTVVSRVIDPFFRAASAYNNWALVFNPTRNFEGD